MHKDAPTHTVTHRREGTEVSFLPVPDTEGQVEREAQGMGGGRVKDLPL